MEGSWIDLLTTSVEPVGVKTGPPGVEEQTHGAVTVTVTSVVKMVSHDEQARAKLLAVVEQLRR